MRLLHYQPKYLKYSGKWTKELHLDNLYNAIQPAESLRKGEAFFGGKPVGLWFSCDEAWKEWCISEDFVDMNNVRIYEAKLKENHNILFMKYPEEIHEFHEEFTEGKTDSEIRFGFPNWTRVAEKWDGMFINPYVKYYGLKAPIDEGYRREVNYLWYYSWDCSSGVIWKAKDIIESFEEVTS